METKNIVVIKEDVKKMRSSCLKLYLKEHPERIGEKISDKELFSSLVRFYACQ